MIAQIELERAWARAREPGLNAGPALHKLRARCSPGLNCSKARGLDHITKGFIAKFNRPDRLLFKFGKARRAQSLKLQSPSPKPKARARPEPENSRPDPALRRASITQLRTKQLGQDCSKVSRTFQQQDFFRKDFFRGACKTYSKAIRLSRAQLTFNHARTRRLKDPTICQSVILRSLSIKNMCRPCDLLYHCWLGGAAINTSSSEASQSSRLGLEIEQVLRAQIFNHGQHLILELAGIEWQKGGKWRSQNRRLQPGRSTVLT